MVSLEQVKLHSVGDTSEQVKMSKHGAAKIGLKYDNKMLRLQWRNL